jgi:hypothetical protein
MLVYELKHLLADLSDSANVLIYSSFDKESRQLLNEDIIIDRNENIMIDCDHQVEPKHTIIGDK